MALWLNAGHGLPMHEVSGIHTTMRRSRLDSFGRVISLQRPLPDSTKQTQPTSMPSVGPEPATPVVERPADRRHRPLDRQNLYFCLMFIYNPIAFIFCECNSHRLVVTK